MNVRDVVIGLCACCAGGSALSAGPAVDWRFLNDTAMEGARFVVYADARSITVKADGNRTMWIRYVFPKRSKVGLRAMNKLMEYDCSEQRLRLLQSTDYSSDGTPVAVHDSPQPWSYAEPETTGATEIQVACGGFTPQFRHARDPIKDADRRMMLPRPSAHD